jgi:hypothetical protein
LFLWELHTMSVPGTISLRVSFPSKGAVVNNPVVTPIANFLDHASTALATFESLLIAEIVAGNTIAGTPIAACGRVAFGMACAMARSCLKPRPSTQTQYAPL